MSAQAKQTPKVPGIGYLSAIDAEAESTRIEAIRLALRQARYVEGQTVTTEYRYADGKLDRISALAAELVRQNVDLIIVTGGDPVIRRPRMLPVQFPL
jgi:putative ABC transport system substrate-binding protein